MAAIEKASTEFRAIVPSGQQTLSRQVFVAYRESTGLNTAEEASAIFDAIIAYSQLEGEAVRVEPYQDYFGLIARTVAEEFLTEQKSWFDGQQEGISPERIQQLIESQIMINQVKVAKAVGDLNGDNHLSQQEFERMATIFVHDEMHALASKSFAALDFDSNGELDWDELDKVTQGEEYLSRIDPLRLIARDLVSQFDSDSNFQINRSEFDALAQFVAASLPVPAEDIAAMFDDAAGENDLISRQETMQILEQELISSGCNDAFTKMNDVFNLVDEDWAGSITLQEVESMKERSLRAIKAIDSDFDGRITSRDVNGMRKTLATLDVDGDGMVSVEDTEALSSLAFNLIYLFRGSRYGATTEADVAAGFDMLSAIVGQTDLNGDGSLSRAELYAGVVANQNRNRGHDDEH